MYHVSYGSFQLVGKASNQQRIFAAKLKRNKAKNRYHSILPCMQTYLRYQAGIHLINTTFVDDHTRVILKELPGVRCSDYINASYIDVRIFHSWMGRAIVICNYGRHMVNQKDT